MPELTKLEQSLEGSVAARLPFTCPDRSLNTMLIWRAQGNGGPILYQRPREL